MNVLDGCRLDGRVLIITGTSSGLGVAFAQASGRAGADVVLAARREDKLAETASSSEVPTAVRWWTWAAGPVRAARLTAR
jgi:NADP-dependent 3-hydroxy acid dehydrogenase YdfG